MVGYTGDSAYQTVYEWERGIRGVSADQAEKLSSVLGVSVSELYGETDPPAVAPLAAGSGKTEALLSLLTEALNTAAGAGAEVVINVSGAPMRVRPVEPPGPAPVQFPLYAYATCGEIRTMDGQPRTDEHIARPADMPESVQPTMAVQVEGDSMVHRDIHDGDVVFVREGADVSSGDVVLARVWALNGHELGMLVKCLKDGRLWSNGASGFEPLIYRDHEIVGRVVWVQRPGRAPLPARDSTNRRFDARDRQPRPMELFEQLQKLEPKEQREFLRLLGMDVPRVEIPRPKE